MENIQIFVTTPGDTEDRFITVPPVATVQQLSAALQALGVSVPDGAQAFLEGEEEPAAQPIRLRNKARVHLGTCRKVQVSVSYAGRIEQKSFPPSVPLVAVQQWAAGKLLANDIDRKEHVLQICNSDQQPSPGTQLGALTLPGCCSACFDLVPSIRVEG